MMIGVRTEAGPTGRSSTDALWPISHACPVAVFAEAFLVNCCAIDPHVIDHLRRSGICRRRIEKTSPRVGGVALDIHVSVQ